MICPCGCVNERDPGSGVWRRASTCAHHAAMQRDPSTLGEEYYRGLGLLDPDAPERYVGQLVEALGPIPRAEEYHDLALEIGCGASPYAAALLAAGYLYHGGDPSPWAVEWTRRHARADRVYVATFEDLVDADPPVFDLILAAHVFEHLADAPAAIAKAARMLRPGGELWVIVPDDEDLCNPEHLWNFDERTLRGCLERAGLEVERMSVRRYIERESFIYARARKP